jgi:hypothetical protein
MTNALSKTFGDWIESPTNLLVAIIALVGGISTSIQISTNFSNALFRWVTLFILFILCTGACFVKQKTKTLFIKDSGGNPYESSEPRKSFVFAIAAIGFLSFLLCDLIIHYSDFVASFDFRGPKLSGGFSATFKLEDGEKIRRLPVKSILKGRSKWIRKLYI